MENVVSEEVELADDQVTDVRMDSADVHNDDRITTLQRPLCDVGQESCPRGGGAQQEHCADDVLEKEKRSSGLYFRYYKQRNFFKFLGRQDDVTGNVASDSKRDGGNVTRTAEDMLHQIYRLGAVARKKSSSPKRNDGNERNGSYYHQIKTMNRLVKSFTLTDMDREGDNYILRRTRARILSKISTAEDHILMGVLLQYEARIQK